MLNPVAKTNQNPPLLLCKKVIFSQRARRTQSKEPRLLAKLALSFAKITLSVNSVLSVRYPSFVFMRSLLVFNKLSILFFILSLHACFEYEETINFKKGFAGFVEITYTVPLNNKSDNTVIKFLPIYEDDINKRINKGLFSKNLKIKDYTLKYLEKNEKEINPMFQKKARVNYKIEFNDLAVLDGVLLGSLFVKKRSNNSISVKREFKSVLKPIDQTSTTGEKKILSESTRLLGEGFIAFRVNFPLTSECRSSKGM
ncbi:MAG: hypothetical protein IPG24_07735 [Leptospiraceae bacterium]|nr:hypothetical protein [Leptospiraceae bacterium]